MLLPGTGIAEEIQTTPTPSPGPPSPARLLLGARLGQRGVPGHRADIAAAQRRLTPALRRPKGPSAAAAVMGTTGFWPGVGGGAGVLEMVSCRGGEKGETKGLNITGTTPTTVSKPAAPSRDAG